MRELPRPQKTNRTNIHHAVYLVICDVPRLNRESKHPKETQNTVKMIVKRCSWGTCDSGCRSQRRLQFIRCVCSHRHVCPRSMGNNSPVFVFQNRSIGYSRLVGIKGANLSPVVEGGGFAPVSLFFNLQLLLLRTTCYYDYATTIARKQLHAQPLVWVNLRP